MGRRSEMTIRKVKPIGDDVLPKEMTWAAVWKDNRNWGAYGKTMKEAFHNLLEREYEDAP